MGFGIGRILAIADLTILLIKQHAPVALAAADLAVERRVSET
jgi:hypothetical protein